MVMGDMGRLTDLRLAQGPLEVLVLYSFLPIP